ncbi:MAG TPA: fatty acid CoA ligase family protein [Desulfatirhabdiaceae bacterium]|nr:fatty acid CoA ligase family protein [Desulfatirhabdiaceae bacterium]
MDPSKDKVFNIASLLTQMARFQPYKRAVVCPSGRDDDGRVTYTHLTFRQLDMESDCLAHGLESVGVGKGVRTLIMVKPGLDFFALTFALFKTGAIPVVVDPGMGLKGMIRCIRDSRPEAFIGISQAHAVRIMNPGAFKSVHIPITVGSRWFWGGVTLRQIRKVPWQSYIPVPTIRNDTAAILFTSGSTGPAKGAVYTHGNFEAQIQTIQSHFQITEDEVDLPTFPLFALFDPALGMTAVVPDMDFTKPAEVDPEKIIEAIINQGVTNMFASPALLNRVGGFGKQNGIKLPSLKRVVSAGAPVSADNIEQFTSVLCDSAEVHTPYGATEAVPVASISSQEILNETRRLAEKGYGTCVGRPLNGLDIRIIRISDSPINQWKDDLVLDASEIGEIAVKGDLVTRHYFENAEADSINKIRNGKETWHRMGDLGWIDRKGRLWYCGRKSHRVLTENGPLYTIPCEAIFNTHPQVFRSALVGVGDAPRQNPVICIQVHPSDPNVDLKALESELLQLASHHILTRDITTILFPKSFPVDVRHNSKIFREELAEWARRKIKS